MAYKDRVELRPEDRTPTGYFPEPRRRTLSEALPFGTTEAVMEYLWPTRDPYFSDLAGWIEKVAGEYVWTKMREVCESVSEHRYTAVQSAHDTSKSFTAAHALAWWISTRPAGEAFAVSTAPTYAQVNAILWRELRRVHRKAELPGRITLDNHWSLGDELVAYGRKPADYDQTAFQGIHARYVLVVIDEACGVPRSLFDAVDALATNVHARVLAIGNPDDPASHFAKVCAPGSGWNTIEISAYDWLEEAALAPPRLRELLVSEEWVEERKRRWGEDSPIYVSKVEGRFPDVSEDTLITPKMIREAYEVELPGIEAGRFGADVADQGQDETVVYHNRGGVIRLATAPDGKPALWHTGDTMTSAGRFKAILDDWRGEASMVIDSIGIGAGVTSRLREQGLPIKGFNASERAHRPDKFFNRRSEQWWAVRELFEANLIDLDPEDEDLAAQLGSMKWWVDSSGRTVVEPKREATKRLGVSPDRADALMYSTVPFDHLPPLSERHLPRHNPQRPPREPTDIERRKM